VNYRLTDNVEMSVLGDQDGVNVSGDPTRSDTLSFVDGSEGDGATALDVGDLQLTRNGTNVDAWVLHSFDPGVNDDALTRVGSGVDRRTSIVAGFEDLEGGGADRDFQDVVFTVSMSDLA